MAQFGRALRSGRRSRVFESRHLDFKVSDFGVNKVWGFFCCIGNFFEFPLQQKSPPGRNALRRSGDMLPGQPVAGENPALQDSYAETTSHVRVLRITIKNITKKGIFQVFGY